MKEHLQAVMGRILQISLWISLLVTAFGGVYYLVEHGHEVNDFFIFQKEPYAATPLKIWRDALTLSPYGIIQLGILLLILTQILRVALVAWYYLKLHNLNFVWLSLFILALLIFSFS